MSEPARFDEKTGERLNPPAPESEPAPVVVTPVDVRPLERPTAAPESEPEPNVAPATGARTNK